MRLRVALVAVLIASSPAAAAPVTDTASEWIDRADRALFLQVGDFRTDLSGLLDLEGYVLDEHPPGLVFGGDDSFLNPRLTLFLDSRWTSSLYALVQARIDRGFDPRARSSGSARFDEYFLRWTPLERPLVNLQVGKFATVFGGWVPRHHSWDNPLITAPLAYENVTIVTDEAAPASEAEFLARRGVPDRKPSWQPVVWGPSYASGASVFGRLGNFDYAAEMKNATLSSRPEVWDGRSRGWEHPTASGRIAWAPDPAWSIAVSASDGAYLQEVADATLPAARGIGDFHETVFGADAQYAWRHLQLWSELLLARFDVPAVGDADTAAYYFEGRYKLTPEIFGALRWNQQLFGTVDDGAGGERAWDRDVWRADAAVGYRPDRHLQGKVQYSYQQQHGPFEQGEQLLALQLTLSF
ncbi:MAG: hypothetical protein QOD06_2594 [Candidatus Binatota bacterium]|nr:hypothetical protein [Candidatus Binatota bacterium]